MSAPARAAWPCWARSRPAMPSAMAAVGLTCATTSSGAILVAGAIQVVGHHDARHQGRQSGKRFGAGDRRQCRRRHSDRRSQDRQCQHRHRRHARRQRRHHQRRHQSGGADRSGPGLPATNLGLLGPHHHRAGAVGAGPGRRRQRPECAAIPSSTTAPSRPCPPTPTSAPPRSSSRARAPPISPA